LVSTHYGTATDSKHYHNILLTKKLSGDYEDYAWDTEANARKNQSKLNEDFILDFLEIELLP